MTSNPEARTQREPTFDEELLLWLGDGPPEVRAADATPIRDIASEAVARCAGALMRAAISLLQIPTRRP